MSWHLRAFQLFNIWVRPSSQYDARVNLLVLCRIRANVHRNTKIDLASILVFQCIAFLHLAMKSSRKHTFRKLDTTLHKGACIIILWTDLKECERLDDKQFIVIILCHVLCPCNICSATRVANITMSWFHLVGSQNYSIQLWWGEERTHRSGVAAAVANIMHACILSPIYIIILYN